MPTARLPIDAAHRAAASDAHPIGAVTGLTDALAGKESSLGNPAADGLVLASTLAGVRSWTQQPRERVLKSVTALSTDHAATWTADPATDTLTASAAHGLTVNTPIAFSNGTGALPGGLSPEPEYYWVVAVPTTTTLQVSAAFGGAAVSITSAGTAGWKVRTLSTFNSMFSYTASSLKTLGAIDVVFDALPAYAHTNGFYPYIYLYPTSCMAFVSLASAAPQGSDRIALSSLGMSGKKYARYVARLHLEMLTDTLVAGQFTYHAVGATDSAFTDGLVYVNQPVGFHITADADVTGFLLTGGYPAYLCPGSTMQVVAAAR